MIITATISDSTRAASALTGVSLTNLYDEHGRELYLELWRRQDAVAPAGHGALRHLFGTYSGRPYQ